MTVEGDTWTPSVERDLLWELFENRYFDLPYHGRPHPLDIRSISHNLISLCREQGLDPDTEIVETVAITHDDCYPTPLVLTPDFPDKEMRSAFSATGRLRDASQKGDTRLWVPPTRKFVPIFNGIARTHFARPVITLEDLIENRADIDNTGQDYFEEVVPNAARLLVERRYLASDLVPYELVQKETAMVLGGYVAKQLFLGDFDVNKQGKLWISALNDNTDRLVNETEDSLKEIAGLEFCKELEERYPPTLGYQKFSQLAA